MKACCFTGHRILSKEEKISLEKKLKDIIEILITEGVTEFVSGGAIGFDQLAADIVLKKREEIPDIRLVFALPCHEQDLRWNAADRKAYKGFLKRADEVIYVSEEYDSACMRRRNYYMVDIADVCIAALRKKGSGTGMTVRYALEKGIKVINLLDESGNKY